MITLRDYLIKIRRKVTIGFFYGDFIGFRHPSNIFNLYVYRHESDCQINGTSSYGFGLSPLYNSYIMNGAGNFNRQVFDRLFQIQSSTE